MFVLADHLKLSKDELHDLATVILRRDITSMKGLEPTQVNRMLDALEGAEKVIEIKRQRLGTE